jgi:DNA-binding beta-propeller fold protein YncE
LVLAVSSNQPQFCPTATWNSNGITFANESIIGRSPRAIFVSANKNTIYVAHRQKSQILVWDEGSINPTKIISGNFKNPYFFFVTSNGDIYIDDGQWNTQVVKWISSTNTFETVMNVNSACVGLFVDINNYLYCSMYEHHRVVKRWLNDSVMTSTIVAGTGEPGDASNELRNPMGIFIDVNLDLYVADCENDRVQLFQSGQLNGITVAASGSTISLDCPSGIVLDAQKYLFITNWNNHRIVGLGPNGFRCLIGCFGKGSQSNQFDRPSTLSFDRSGNMFVSDERNDRIQKFQYLGNSSSKLEIVE